MKKQYDTNKNMPLIVQGTDFFEHIIEDMKNGIMVIQNDGQIVFVNQRLQTLLEIENMEAGSIREIMLQQDNPENDSFFECIVDVIYSHGKQYQKKVKYVTPSGKKYYLLVTASYLERTVLQEEKGGVVISVLDETTEEILWQKKNSAVFGLVGCIVLISLGGLMFAIYDFTGRDDFPHTWISRFIELTSFSLLFILLKYTDFTVQDILLKPTNLKRELKEALLIVGGMISALVILKMVVIAGGEGVFFGGNPFFDWLYPGNYYIKYIFITFFQEFLARCILQQNLNRILDGKYGKWSALVIASVVFMALHTHQGLIFMLGAGILNFVLGMIYNRHQSIVATSIVHYSFGIMGKVLRWI